MVRETTTMLILFSVLRDPLAAAERGLTFMHEQGVIELQQLKETRDNVAVKTALADLRTQALDNQNLGNAMIEAVSCYATIGEICETLRSVYGVYKPPTVF